MKIPGELQQLSLRIGYTFKDPQLLKLALSHRSVEGPHNERLEFLGDSVLGFIMAEALYHQFPRGQEGELSRLRSSLVKGETLVQLAENFNLGKSLVLGIGELKSGGQRRHSILENALEALIGAIYLDVGMETCRTVVLHWFEERLSNISLSDNVQDPKSRLQEYLQAKGLPLPLYQLVRTEGPEHGQIFFIACQIPVLSVEVQASGLSRKQAEQRAAAEALQLLLKEKI